MIQQQFNLIFKLTHLNPTISNRTSKGITPRVSFQTCVNYLIDKGTVRGFAPAMR